MTKINAQHLLIVLLMVCTTVITHAQTSAPAAGNPPAMGGGRPGGPGGQGQLAPGGRRGGGLFPTIIKDDSLGFVSIFNGKTLDGWDGDTMFWRAENGEIIGESTPEKVVKINSFLIWRGEKVKDFELKVDFKINGTNSGVQYRSIELPEIGKWILKGIQADMDFTNSFTGNVHEERGRTGHVILSQRGNVIRISDGPVYKSVAKIADPVALRGVININGWNTYHIIARGPVMIHIVNGQLMSMAIDEDTKNFTPEGLIGFQMHVGNSFKVEYRNILLKKL